MCVCVEYEHTEGAEMDKLKLVSGGTNACKATNAKTILLTWHMFFSTVTKHDG